ncbi:MAG: helix-turn-helix domain-containing protein [Thomasclavelia spiroformis]|uniref:helix-turn-helix domain-containing protein n=1 Tax=Thomasclavelia spiroformis TaxID=29348 RepID=UPI0039940983
MNDLKKLIKGRRKELGLTLLDIAKVCNVSEATVSRWESGDIGDMKRSRIAALAKILQISPSIIVGTDEDDENDYLGNHYENIEYLKDKPELLELYEDIVANDQLVLLFDKAKKLSPEDLEQVLKIIDTFNKETR